MERTGKEETTSDERKRQAHVAHATGENEWFTPPEYIAVGIIVVVVIGVLLVLLAALQANRVGESRVPISKVA